MFWSSFYKQQKELPECIINALILEESLVTCLTIPFTPTKKAVVYNLLDKTVKLSSHHRLT